MAAADLHQRLRDACVVPDVVDRVGGGAALEVSFGGRAVPAGAALAPRAAASAPDVVVRGGDERALHTLVCVDPDAPDPRRPVNKEWLHLLVTDWSIERGSFRPGDAGAGAGAALVPWAGPSPPKGRHRYVFLLFRQPGPLGAAAADPTRGKRARFSARDFAARHGLGDPVAATFFYASAGRGVAAEQ